MALFDTFAMSRALLPRHPEFFSADQYHPSDDGYRIWADELWPLVNKVLTDRDKAEKAAPPNARRAPS